MNKKFSSADIAKEEIDEPIFQYNYSEKTPLEFKTNDKDWFNTIKGHNLLGWSISLIFIIYLIEFFYNKGSLTEVSKHIIEIFKLVIFSLMGYLFGTSKKEN